MGFRAFIANTYLRFSSWTFVHDETPQKFVMIGAPHTSYMDGVLMVAAFWKTGLPLHFLVKDSAAKIPVIGWIIKKVGGLAVERSHHHGMVDQVVEQANASDAFSIVLAPKGTRAKKDYWKSGFYHIALGAHIPVVLGFIDSTTRTFGWGPAVMMTGDAHADMERLRAFYRGKQGIHPEKTSVPRLKEELKEEQGD
ncbi:MAG: 1-acyl-sn-glycerol-3-phosphate acyltransferase [Actinomycetaceae bacterium]|nr:1-acyl-sn-glycerol-3-phosphate acyltransferase [Actinomycetaceae bacterium]MDY6082460.1 1-acyl-sn-glycerol-3-phosphate acyltransferase [Actinomycetaceae bacterium]